MTNPFAAKPLAAMRLEELKKRDALLKTIIYVLIGFLLINIGYTTVSLISQKGYSLVDLVRRNTGALAGFGGSLLLASALKKVKAEISLRA